MNFQTYSESAALKLLTVCYAGGLLINSTCWAQTNIPVLPETLVTATMAPTSPKKIGSAITVITADEIEQRGATYVPELLRDVPGLAVNKSGPVGGLSQIRIRGTEANQTLFLIDGIEANDPNTSEPLWDDVFPGDIEHIEVLRGSQSSVHGSDAIGGVIHIITKRGRGAPKVTATTEAGSFDTVSARSGVSGGTDDYHYAFNVSGYTTRGVSASRPSPANPQPNEADGYENISASAKLGATLINALDLQVTGRFTRARVELDSQDIGFDCCHDMLDAQTKETKRIQFLGGTTGTYRLFDGAWEHGIKAQWFDVHSKSFEFGQATFKSVGRKIKLGYHNTLRFDIKALASSRHTITTGLETENEKAVGFNFKESRDQDGFFGEYQLELFDRFTLTGSGRHDRNDVFKDADTWRTTAAYRIEEWGTKIRTSYGTGVKNPTFTELFGFNAPFTPNPNLQPESNEGYDFGVDQSFWQNRVHFGGTFFINRVKDAITGSGTSSQNSVGTTKIWGSEWTVDADITNNFSVNASYTYTNHEDPNGLELLRRAKHIASTNLEYRFIEDRARLFLTADFNGTQADNDFDPAFSATRVQLDAFTNITVGGSYRIREGLVLKGRIENLLDDQYEEVLGFQNTGIGGYLGLTAEF